MKKTMSETTTVTKQYWCIRVRKFDTGKSIGFFTGKGINALKVHRSLIGTCAEAERIAERLSQDNPGYTFATEEAL